MALRILASIVLLLSVLFGIFGCLCFGLAGMAYFRFSGGCFCFLPDLLYGTPEPNFDMVLFRAACLFVILNCLKRN